MASGFGPERIDRLNRVAQECLSAMDTGSEMEEIQMLLAARGLGPIDAIFVTRQLLGGRPDDLGRAKRIVFESAHRRREREIHRQFVEALDPGLEGVEAVEEETSTKLSTGCA